ncbi:MAG: hypothetical protein NTZ09_17690 [Candidatus Hydrogenedentes bacterium]|nr:hypothetical protein [Candidatus Hydrogenedentota bacterium]
MFFLKIFLDFYHDLLYIYIVKRARPNPGLTTPILGFSRETLQALDRESLIQIVLNLQEEIHDHRIALQELKDELRRLRGEKGRPRLNPAVPDEPSKEQSKRRTAQGRKSGKIITVTRRERLAVDQRILPNDAVFKGTRKILIQDIKILTDNVEFEIERFYSPSEKKTYERKGGPKENPQLSSESGRGESLRHLPRPHGNLP